MPTISKLTLSPDVKCGAGQARSNLVVRCQINVVGAAALQLLQLVTRCMSRQVHLLNAAVGPFVVKCEGSDGRISISCALPMHQNAAGSGAGNVENWRSWRHLNNQTVRGAISSNSIIHLAREIAGIGDLQIGNHELARIEHLTVVESN